MHDPDVDEQGRLPGSAHLPKGARGIEDQDERTRLREPVPLYEVQAALEAGTDQALGDRGAARPDEPHGGEIRRGPQRRVYSAPMARDGLLLLPWLRTWRRGAQRGCIAALGGRGQRARRGILRPVKSAGVSELRQRHRGPVITPDDDAFEAARATFNGMIDRRPALVARPLDIDDVVTAVSFAAQSELPVAVRGGGHGVAGHCVGDGSLVVDLRLLRGVMVDPETRTATCGGGALWEDLDPPCQRHGLATPGGTFGDTGVAGLTLGGGIGHLIGAHGLTLDNLLAATVVTADSRVVRASDSENDELFWALRGGGGNFGVVVDFTFRLHPVGRLLGGLLYYRIEDGPMAVRAWRELMAEAPDNLVCFAMIARRLEGESAAVVSVAYLGDAEDGREAIRRLVDASPVRDGVRPMYYPELQEVFGRQAFGERNYWSGRFLRELPDELIEGAVDPFIRSGLPGGILLEPIHGAAARVRPEATAFTGREARYNATFVGSWLDEADDGPQIQQARDFSAALAPWTIGGGYLNYASEASGHDGLETEFGAERMARLRAVKREYDPANVFRFNHNIAP